MKRHIPCLALLVIVCACTRAADPDASAQLAAIIPQLAVPNEAERLAPQNALEKLEFSVSAPDKDAARTAYCTAVAKALEAPLPTPTRLWLLRSLERVGRAESVAVETKLMSDPDETVRDAAIRALAANSSGEANMVILQGLKKETAPAVRIALLNALGFKRIPDSDRYIARDVMHADEGVRTAARNALARIGHRAETGAMVEVAKLYEMGRAGQSQDIPALLAGLDAPNLKVRQAAVQAIGMNPSFDMTTALVNKLKTVPTELKPALLAVLARRFDISSVSNIDPKLDSQPFRMTVAEELKSPDDAVKIAAAKALIDLGNHSSVAPLMALIGNASDSVQRAVREALDLMRGPDVDEALIGFLGNATPALRAEAAQRLGARQAESAAPALAGLLKDADGNVVSEALKALAAVGRKTELPAVLEVFSKTIVDADREQAAKSAWAIARRDPSLETRADSFIAAQKDAPDNQQALLLNILAQLGGPKALDTVRAALTSPNKSAQDGAVRALANWVDAAPLADTLAIAKSSDNETHRVLALRGYFRLAGLPGARPAKDTTQLILDGLAAAKKPDDKKLALASLAEVQDINAFKKCVELISDPAVTEEACAATVKSAKYFIKSHSAEVAAAMQTVSERAKSPTTKKTAADNKTKTGR